MFNALQRSNRQDEISEFKKKLAISFDDYARIIDSLMEAGQYEEAEVWCRKAFTSAYRLNSWNWGQIEGKLALILWKLQRPLEEASIYAKWYFADQKRPVYQKMKDACLRAKVWDVVREGCLSFLRTGTLPDAKKWPLDPTSLNVNLPKWVEFPLYTQLMEVALCEQRSDDVLALYQTLVRSKNLYLVRSCEDEALTLLEKDYPEFVLEEYFRMVRDTCCIYRISDSTADLFRKLYALCVKMNRLDAWNRLVKSLLKKNGNNASLVNALQTAEKGTGS